MKKLNTKKGFSLIELLVVIAIIGVLSAVGITAYTGYTASAKEQAARTQFAQMVSFVNAEIAKCALGSGDYNWPSTATKDTCSDGIDANTNIRSDGGDEESGNIEVMDNHPILNMKSAKDLRMEILHMLNVIDCASAWEKEIYVTMLSNHIKEENEKRRRERNK